jgi:hypothetical protein
MKRAVLMAVLLAGTAFATLPAKADLSIGVLGAGAVSQSQSNPCIICATNAQQPTINGVEFGFNNFNSTGNDVGFNLFSSAVTGSFGDGVEGTPYQAGFLINALQQLGDFNLTFGVAIDINTAGGAAGNKETLTAFRMINLDGAGGNPEVVFNLGGLPFAMPKQNNGNGFADYLITGFDLSGIDVGDRILFQASWDHATDGGESFYIVPIVSAAVPGPIVGAGPVGLAAAGLFGLNFWRRRRNGGTLPA